MDKLVAFFQNVWFRRGVAVVCWAYTGLLIWIAWLSFGYFFEFDNSTSLFVLYLFVNVAALGLLILTRRQVITMVNCMIMPPIVFAIVIFSFGNWYMILPPLAVVVAMFFINTANETLKTVIGTFYLLLYVIGVMAYIVINLLMGDLSFNGVDLSQRDTEYEVVAPAADYRIVRYIDMAGDNHMATYYVEYTLDDVDIPFGLCKKVNGCQWIATIKYTGSADDPIKWVEGDRKTPDSLLVEGVARENPYLIVVEEIDTSSGTSSKPASSKPGGSSSSSSDSSSSSSAA